MTRLTETIVWLLEEGVAADLVWGTRHSQLGEIGMGASHQMAMA